MTIELGVSLCDDRPRVRVGRRFAGEVPCVELNERSVNVIGFERDMRRDPVVAVDLDNVEHLRMECFGPLVSARHAGATQGEAIAAGRDHCRCHFRDSDIGQGPHVCDVSVSTALASGAHHPTAIVGRDVVGQQFRHFGPVAGNEARSESLD